MRRREMLIRSGVAVVGLSTFPLGWAAAEGKRPKILYFTRSAGFEHSVVQRQGDKLSYSEKIFSEMGAKHGFDVVCTKDGAVFDGDLDQFDAFVFYTSGDLTTTGGKAPNHQPMSSQGKDRFLQAIAAGKGFVGLHAANDSFRAEGNKVTDYIAMVGGEFVTHGNQQKATMKIVSPKFPGVESLGPSFAMLEEWYALKKFAKDLHVILVQETAGMSDPCYQRPPFPATWARRHQQGRVFYTSLGHREDVWTSSPFEKIFLGGLSWTLKRVEADVTPNLAQVTPNAEPR